LPDPDPEVVSAVEKDFPWRFVRGYEPELTASDTYEQSITEYQGAFVGPRLDSDYAKFVVLEFTVWMRRRWRSRPPQNVLDIVLAPESAR